MKEGSGESDFLKNRMEKIIIGLAGEMGSGKGTVAHYLCDRYRFSSFRYSDALRDILDRLYLEKNRENISKTSKMLRETFGQDILSRVIAEDSKKGISDIVIDGIRREEDIIYLKGAKNFFLLYIEVSERDRYERLVARSENPGDATKTFEAFQREQSLDSDNRVQSLRERANYIVKNNGTLLDLYQKIGDIVEETRKGKEFS